ncbi:PfkB family carbohydrate kinase [Chryseolinea lacunae]|uniref:Carbohydrate kinase PfkB domain-containing protein n=1 Tax=Chryseolinea lacunae TaxID=2801331 RepID=A0ABS1L203_9BACT|nr:PfkB family carbohydrate kinase [Chryseolinea lacunae]MBL0745721.1 hypothetical protein [Chryseolinea lacunae]
MKKKIKYNTSPTVYGTGLVSLDIVVSANSEEPSYHWAGGTCGNVLTMLSYLGWKSFPIARLNEDAASMRVKTDMKRWGVDLTYAGQPPSTSTPIITQENSIDKKGRPIHKFHWKNCPKCGAWLPNYRAVTLTATADIKEKVSSGNIFFFDRISPGAIDLAEHFKSLGAIIFFEPSAKSDLKQLKRALSLADIVKYSDKRFLSSLSDIRSFTSAFLEIQTLGSEGLRYRTHTSSKLDRRWRKLPAFQVSSIKDTCGCGDWTSAGFISKVCNIKAEDLKKISEQTVVSGLKYGQALAAWNCGFEGARGGMYRLSKDTFEKEIQHILESGPLKRKSQERNMASEILDSEICLCSSQ